MPEYYTTFHYIVIKVIIVWRTWMLLCILVFRFYCNFWYMICTLALCGTAIRKTRLVKGFQRGQNCWNQFQYSWNEECDFQCCLQRCSWNVEVGLWSIKDQESTSFWNTYLREAMPSGTITQCRREVENGLHVRACHSRYNKSRPFPLSNLVRGCRVVCVFQLCRWGISESLGTHRPGPK